MKIKTYVPYFCFFFSASLFGQGWECREVENVFDGKKQISFTKCISSSSKLYDDVELIIRRSEKYGLEFFLNGVGYTGASNTLQICFDGERHYKGVTGSGSEDGNAVFIKTDNGITQNQFIFEILNSSKLYIRHEHSIGSIIDGYYSKTTRDYTFELENGRGCLIQVLGYSLVNGVVKTSTTINYDSLDMDKIKYSLYIKSYYSRYQKYPAYIKLTRDDSIHILKQVVLMMNRRSEFIEHDKSSNHTEVFNNTRISIILSRTSGASFDSPQDLSFDILYGAVPWSTSEGIKIKKENVYVGNSRESKKYIEENNKDLFSVFSNGTFNEPKALPRVLGFIVGLGLSLPLFTLAM